MPSRRQSVHQRRRSQRRPRRRERRQDRLTLDPGVNRALLAAGILVKPLDPGVVGSDWVDRKPTITFTFPITDGVIDPGTLAGSIEHSGGLLFLQHRQRRVAQGDGLQDRHR